MDEQLQQLVILLVQAAMQGDLEAAQYIQQVMQAAQQGDKDAAEIAQVILAVAQQMQQAQQVRAAKFGAKLNYIRSLRGMCPVGYEMLYFKSGGKVCKKCIKKHAKGKPVNMPNSDKDLDKYFKDDTKSNENKIKLLLGTDKPSHIQNLPHILGLPGIPNRLDAIPRPKYTPELNTEDWLLKEKKVTDPRFLGGRNAIKRFDKGDQLPTARPANERYKNGSLRSQMNGLSILFGMDPLVEEIVTGPKTENYAPARIKRTISGRSLEPIDGVIPYELTDTVIEETPPHRTWPFFDVQTRKASNSDKNRDEFNILNRRFEEAKNAATNKKRHKDPKTLIDKTKKYKVVNK